MQVYGDQTRQESPERLLERLAAGREQVRASRGAARHAALVRMLLDAGELAQGLLDFEFTRHRADASSVLRAMTGALTHEIAARVAAWPREEMEPLRLTVLDELSGARLPGTVQIRVPEGYAFYAVYPELYAAAAHALQNRDRTSLCVVGIRSIGASLAPVVAAAAGGEVKTVTLRPTGPPLGRTLSVTEELARYMVGRGNERRFAVVDEGPWLSGSAFNAVGDWLERRGVGPERVVYFPSHAGSLGPRASAEHRTRWASARRLVSSFDEVFLRRAIVPDVDVPLLDVSAGRWREIVFARESKWPAVHVGQERRKYLFTREGRRWLLKFSGVGRYGEEKLQRAERLGRLGLIPPVFGLRHGFLLFEWLEGKPLWMADVPVDREQLLSAVASYITALADSFPSSPARHGAAPARLLEMARHNTQQSLGTTYAKALGRWQDQLAAITRRSRHALTDNKMHAWEWIVTADGRLLKCDALDHHCGPDLVGPQDVAWDVVAAQVELNLSPTEGASLIERVARRSRYSALPAQIEFYTMAYLAFQVGHHTLAMDLAQNDGPELARLKEATRRYALRLQQRIEA